MLFESYLPNDLRICGV